MGFLIAVGAFQADACANIPFDIVGFLETKCFNVYLNKERVVFVTTVKISLFQSESFGMNFLVCVNSSCMRGMYAFVGFSTWFI